MTKIAEMPSGGASGVIYFGTPEIAVGPLEELVANSCNVRLVVTRPDVRRGRGNEVTPSPVKVAARKLGLTVVHTVEPAIEMARNEKSLLGVVVAYGELFKTDILEALPMINVHFSLLPRWRGAAPVERAILAGDKKTGVCIMRVVEKLDEGEIYGSQETLIADNEDADSLRLRLVELSRGMLVEKVQNGCGFGSAQSGEAVYAKKIKPDDLEINWQNSAEQVLRQVRVGGAFTWVNTKRLKVAGARISESTSPIGGPGSICLMNSESCVVATGDGCVALERVQPEGKSVMSIEVWLNGARLDAQTQFGK